MVKPATDFAGSAVPPPRALLVLVLLLGGAGSAQPALRPSAWVVGPGRGGALFGRVGAGGDVNGDGYSDLVVGSTGFSEAFAREGKAWLYLGGPAGPSTTPAWSALGGQAGADFGRSVAVAGDVNGDHFGDAVVISWSYDGPEVAEGRAYLYLGGDGGLSTTAAWTFETDQTGGYLLSCAGAGDVNADGFADVLLGAEGVSNGETNEGRVYLFFGGPGGLAPTPGWSYEANSATARLARVAGVGDVDGDGYDDVVVGAAELSNGETGEGRVYLFRGRATGIDVMPSWTYEGNEVNAKVGVSVDRAGDVNRDGYDDFLVGTVAASAGGVLLFLGSSTGPAPTPAWTSPMKGMAAGADLDKDGYSDVVVGDPTFSNPESAEGRLVVYAGGPGGVSAAPVWSVESDVAQLRLGEAVAIAGDLDGDGLPDVVAGSVSFNVSEGRALAFFGARRDAGATDAGAARDGGGADDGGVTTDAGSTADGGAGQPPPGPRFLQVGCGCHGSGDGLAPMLALAALAMATARSSSGARRRRPPR